LRWFLLFTFMLLLL